MNVGIGGVFGLDGVNEGAGVSGGARQSEFTIVNCEGVV